MIKARSTAVLWNCFTFLLHSYYSLLAMVSLCDLQDDSPLCFHSLAIEGPKEPEGDATFITQADTSKDLSENTILPNLVTPGQGQANMTTVS